MKKNKLLQMKLLENTALDWGYDPEKILGFHYSSTDVYFRVKLKGVNVTEIIPHKIMCREHTDVRTVND